MNDYDPELHRVDADAWERTKNQHKGYVTIDRWTKNGTMYVSLSYWAYRGSEQRIRYRIHVVAPTLEEAIYRAERREVDTVVGAMLTFGR